MEARSQGSPADLTANTLGPDDVSVLLETLRLALGADLAAYVASGPERPSIEAPEGISDEALAWLRGRALQWLTHGSGTVGQEVGGPTPGWRLLLARSASDAGAVVVGRTASGSRSWSATDVASTKAFATALASLHTTDNSQIEGRDRALDELVTRVAVELMQVSRATVEVAMRATLELLTQFFEVDTSFLRRHDHDRGLSVLVAEWPPRQEVPEPDPLGEVPFTSDPLFEASQYMTEPLVVRPATSGDAYQQRVEEAVGMSAVSLATVPLLVNQVTAGILGFIKFGDRAWEPAEVNALQAVASLIVQLQARIDAEDRLQYHAYHDELTDLPNRRALMEELESRLGRPDDSTAFLFIDLDRFKLLNDSLGHAAGDRLLTTIGDRLRQHRVTGAFVSRLAGDEFVVLVDCENDDDLRGHAESLRAVIAAPIEIAGHHVTRTASVGIAESRPGVSTPEALLAQADAALHRAKRRGGNQVSLFDEVLRVEAADRSQTELLLREAIDSGQLLLHYQPEFNLRSGQLLAVEALLRWDHPGRGLLSAGCFIDVAEESGLIVDVGQWVLREACRQVAAWRTDEALSRLVVRVNLSPAQLASRNIVGLVADCLTLNHLPGRVLCLEITEHAVMQDIEQALASLHELKMLGVTFAIDDFGTGFSSMSQLKRLPVDALKVDQSFVAGLTEDAGDRAIVDATARLAQSFGLDLIAEGVESVDTAEALVALGCYRAQGYLLSRPKPPEELQPILSAGRIELSAFRRRPATTAKGDRTNTLVQ
jgi:diguanylate cyclase (GGDEF)-like protein